MTEFITGVNVELSRVLEDCALPVKHYEIKRNTILGILHLDVTTSDAVVNSDRPLES